MVTVACVYKPGKGFREEYVLRLWDSLVKQPVPFQFMCLTTDSQFKKLLGRAAMKIPDVLPGWWNKMYLFHPGVFTGRVIYFDLDTVITGDISPLLKYNEKWPLFLSDFNDKGELATGIMSWEAEQLDFIYNKFMENSAHFIEKHDKGSRSNRGDQAFIRPLMGLNSWCPVQKIQPNVVSYKCHVLRGIGGGASIVAFHGNPRPHEVNWMV
jgi:hypothetical protein